jgi:type II restriction/modification system DNA methylase subunit YeeA
MDPFRHRWEKVKAEAIEIAQKRDETDSAGWRTQYNKQLSSLLLGFAEELATIQILDPACGSGNFLYVALRQLLDLWKEISVLGGKLGLSLMSPISSTAPSPTQLHGIEINLYAHQLAQATIWIGYIQWLRENGYGEPPEPILKPLDNILLQDAVLSIDDEGRIFEPEWPHADVIIGNPPFLGGKKMRSELGDQYVDELFELYEGRVPHEADLVCYWFEKARAEIADSSTKLAGLLATQGIRGGSNRKALERIKETSDIFWAQSDRDWILDGALVHVSMIGFGDAEVKQRELDGKLVRRINADLTSKIDLTTAEKLPENQNLSFMGVTPAGPFDVPGELAQKWLLEVGNPNGKSNSVVLRPYYNGTDINRQPRNVWTIDFGIDMAMGEASLYVKPFEYIRKNVYPIRRKNKRASYREKWWLYAETRPAMREALEPLDRYIGTSMVSKHRFFSWIPPQVLPANLIIVVARDDDYFFGALQSKIHILWASAMGTQLREASSGQRYTPSSTFETFPFPWQPGQEPKDDSRVKLISEAAGELVEKRDAWLNPPGANEEELKSRTLTNLYNERPTWLDLAHQKLDRAVLDAYGWPHDLTDE